MKILKDIYDTEFDIAICGLGFESRAISAYVTAQETIKKLIVLGYDENTSYFSYQSNKKRFEKDSNLIFEVGDNEILDSLNEALSEENFDVAKNVLVDITVMSRHRLATILGRLIDTLSSGSKLTITYTLSTFIDPPNDATPVKKVCEIAEGFEGVLGDLSFPASVIIGLGYEKGKALGISNYLDSWKDYLFVPKSPISEFEKYVRENNTDLIESIPKEQIITYNVCSPYSTYLELKSLVLTLCDFSRPLLIPLGPKILSALCIILNKELNQSIPVWRVSSEYMEAPVDRPSSGHEIKFTLQL